MVAAKVTGGIVLHVSILMCTSPLTHSFALVRACSPAGLLAYRFVDEDGQAHVVPKKGAAAASTGERILRRTNPQLI